MGAGGLEKLCCGLLKNCGKLQQLKAAAGQLEPGSQWEELIQNASVRTNFRGLNSELQRPLVPVWPLAPKFSGPPAGLDCQWLGGSEILRSSAAAAGAACPRFGGRPRQQKKLSNLSHISPAKVRLPVLQASAIHRKRQYAGHKRKVCTSS